jgi:hypothetical protein
LQDFDPLVKNLQPGSISERTGAETAFRHLVGALTAGPVGTLAGVAAGPYCDLLRIITQKPNELVAAYSEMLLRAILDQRSSLTSNQFLAAGEAARNLLNFAWSHQ